MAEMLSFELVSPERLLLSRDAHCVVVPGIDGDFGVYAGHAPVISTLRPGVIEVTAAEGEAPERYFVRGGFVEVTGAGLTVLAEESVPLGELDSGQLAQHIKNAEEDVAFASEDETRRRAQVSIDHLRQAVADCGWG